MPLAEINAALAAGWPSRPNTDAVTPAQTDQSKPVERARTDLLRSQRIDPASRGDASGLTEADRQVIADLRARDREVRAHEQAHATVGGPYAGSPSYTYQAGPDGQRYAVAGQVPIDGNPVPDDPEETVRKMEIVKAAALAPAEPSTADRQVAALADAQRAQALADLSAIRRADRSGNLDTQM